jgi:hypothetical protein
MSGARKSPINPALDQRLHDPVCALVRGDRHLAAARLVLGRGDDPQPERAAQRLGQFDEQVGQGERRSAECGQAANRVGREHRVDAALQRHQ